MSITSTGTTVVPVHRHLQSLPVHPVGTVPAALSHEMGTAMIWFLEHRGGAPLTALPFDTDPRWIIDWLDNLARIPALELAHPGDSRGYDDMPYYRIRPGHQLTPEDLSMGRVEQTETAFAILETLDTGGAVDRLQVSIPNAFDRALFASGSPEAAAEWMPDMQTSVRTEVAEIAARWGERVQLQLETPAVLASYHRTPREDWPLLTTELVQQVTGVIGAAPDARWILHLCYGDLEHQALFTLVDLDAAVQFLNALAEALAAYGIPMPTVHLPVAYGNAAPPTNPGFFRALLWLRRGIRIIAGVVSEDYPTQSSVALSLIIDALGEPVEAIAAGCGHGRRTVTAAAANMALAARLAHEWSPAQTRRSA
ncbi:hypothetical protein BS329_15385 [Amycolatopsis coloradensis]|uniref:Methionine synthase n=1 Tax=Amycolatopsis coloradensis TaxID=76021 RepID=A0A1R0KU37_9PSEU|nr:hypothetical protein [Amycolatopsis coloradensis]OLZ51647.1 hypothetical protein BS329_15385 [Amycolatopsis coloradensis]